MRLSNMVWKNVSRFVEAIEKDLSPYVLVFEQKDNKEYLIGGRERNGLYGFKSSLIKIGVRP